MATTAGRLPALHRLDPAVVVDVLVQGTWWPGFASAWRGQRVFVSWTVAPGLQHIGWVDAQHLRRT